MSGSSYGERGEGRGGNGGAILDNGLSIVVPAVDGLRPIRFSGLPSSVRVNAGIDFLCSGTGPSVEEMDACDDGEGCSRWNIFELAREPTVEFANPASEARRWTRLADLYHGVAESSCPAVDMLRSPTTSGLAGAPVIGGLSCRILFRLNHVPVVERSRSLPPLDAIVLTLGLVDNDADMGEAELGAGDVAAAEVNGSALSVAPVLPEVMVIGIEGTGGTSIVLLRSGTPLLVEGRIRNDGEWRRELKNPRAEELPGVGGAVGDDGIGSATGGIAM